MITLSNIYSFLDKQENMIFAFAYSVTVQADGKVRFKGIENIYDYKRKSFVIDEQMMGSQYCKQLCFDHLTGVDWKQVAVSENKEWPTPLQFPRVDLDHDAYRERQEERQEQQMNEYFDQSNEQL